MPTKLDRVQVLFKKDIFKKLKEIANIERRSLSSLVGGIVEEALDSKKYQSILLKEKAKNLKAKAEEGKLLIKDILNPDINNEIKFDSNYKLKKIEAILSFISESNQNEIEHSILDNVLVDDVLEPNSKLNNVSLDTDKKLKKLRLMLNKINK